MDLTSINSGSALIWELRTNRQCEYAYSKNSGSSSTHNSIGIIFHGSPRDELFKGLAQSLANLGYDYYVTLDVQYLIQEVANDPKRKFILVGHLRTMTESARLVKSIGSIIAYIVVHNLTYDQQLLGETEFLEWEVRKFQLGKRHHPTSMARALEAITDMAGEHAKSRPLVATT